MNELVIDGGDERLAFLGIPGKIKIKYCAACVTEMDYSFCRWQEDGESEFIGWEFAGKPWSPKVPPDGSGTVCADVWSNHSRFVLSQKPVSMNYCKRDERSAIGGRPCFLNHPNTHYAKCPQCGKTMTHLAQLDAAYCSLGVGVEYVQICKPCKTAAVSFMDTEREVAMEGKLRNMVSLYLMAEDRMLLLYRIGSRVLRNPCWCGIGGHFEKEELNDARAALLREVSEEIGLVEKDLEDLRLRYITLRQKDGEIRQNYYFFARLATGTVVQDTCDEGVLEWVPLAEVCGRNMPYTAGYVIRHYLETGRQDESLYCGVADRQGVQFVTLE